MTMAALHQVGAAIVMIISHSKNMKILLLTIGKTDEDYLITGIKKYVGRIGHYASFEMR